MEGEKWMDIRIDRQKGLSYTDIGRKYHIDPRTTKRYAKSDTQLVYSLSDPKPSKLDAYKRLLRKLDINQFIVVQSTEKRHSQSKTFSSIAVAFGKNMKAFQAAIGVLNSNTFGIVML